ncbi:MAG: NADH-quinone oxidoreductase subunit C [Chlamydiota bacterium]
MSEVKSISLNSCFSTKEIPVFPFPKFQEILFDTVKEKEGKVLSLFASPLSNSLFRLYLFLSIEKEKKIWALSTDVKDKYPAFTPHCPSVHLFEREIFETWNILPEGHPQLHSVRYPLSSKQLIGEIPFFSVEGTEIHEVSVGPVHAGIIEPGHFRFQCHGEKVLHLEISLGYQHRGLQKALLQGPNVRTRHYMETIAGDTTIGHTLAYFEAIETFSNIEVPIRAQYFRGIALELERLANHTGDLGGLANDIGYLPTTSYCGRLRGDFLNMTARLCGNRLGRDLLCLGGVTFDLTQEEIAELSTHLQKASQDTIQAIELLWRSSFVIERFEKTGVLSKQTAKELGVVGFAARASGLPHDIRKDFPFGIYKEIPISMATHTNGDVFARAYVRFQEIQHSISYIQMLLDTMPKGPVHSDKPLSLPSNSCTLSLVEGWRGEICHVIMTDSTGKFQTYQPMDPSFHNWAALSMVLREEEISNFPLCNKSFNLSYCGHDL